MKPAEGRICMAVARPHQLDLCGKLNLLITLKHGCDLKLVVRQSHDFDGIYILSLMGNVCYRYTFLWVYTFVERCELWCSNCDCMPSWQHRPSPAKQGVNSKSNTSLWWVPFPKGSPPSLFFSPTKISISNCHPPRINRGVTLDRGTWRCHR